MPALGYYLQAGALHPRLLAVCALPMALQFAMLLAIEFPDAAGDAAVGKRTIVVRIGGRGGARLYAAVTIGAFGALPLLPFAGLPVLVATAPLVLAPIAIWQSTRVVRGGYADSARFEGIAFWSVALLTSAGAIQLAATIVWAAESRRRRRCPAARASAPGAARMPTSAARASAGRSTRNTSARVSQSCARSRRRRSRSKRARWTSPSAR